MPLFNKNICLTRSQGDLVFKKYCSRFLSKPEIIFYPSMPVIKDPGRISDFIRFRAMEWLSNMGPNFQDVPLV